MRKREAEAIPSTQISFHRRSIGLISGKFVCTYRIPPYNMEVETMLLLASVISASLACHETVAQVNVDQAYGGRHRSID